MRILLARPPRPKQAITVSDFMFSEPIGLEMIYGLLKSDHDVEIFDMMVEKGSLKDKVVEYEPDAVGITSLCIDVKVVIALCREVKAVKSDIVTLAGGTQAYLSPLSFSDESVDYIFEFVDGENIRTFFREFGIGAEIPSLPGVRASSDGYKSHGAKGRNGYFLPDRQSTKKYRSEYSYFGYRPAAIMEYGIGCEKACDFCLRWRIEGFKEELLDLGITRKDLMSIEEDTIMLMDNDFFASELKVRTFLNLIRELGLRKNFIVYASVKGILDFEPLVREFHELGLKAVLVGYETFSDEELDIYRKKSDTSDNLKAARILKNIGIDVWASFMAHPDWSADDFRKFRKYIGILKPQTSSINPLTPFPNLPMYGKYKDRLLHSAEEYDKWSFGQVTIRPKNMSLRRYYYELLITNLYVNLVVNSKTEMLRRFGIGNIVRIAAGSMRTLSRYIKLMASAE
jgi:radical SAM superfamily enzyme YgiQ (UPF0313 family)